MRLPEPTTQEEWWDNLTRAWGDIMTCFQRCQDENLRRASSGRHASEFVWDDGRRHLLRAALESRDHQALYRALQDLWEKAPDDPVIRTWPSWFVLCDLCSEYPELFHP